MRLSIIEYKSLEYIAMCRLRNEILRKPIGLQLTQEEIERDANDILLACFNKNELVACCILTPDDDKSVRMRQMAVSKSYQEKGIGRKLVLFAESTARKKGFASIWMHARKTAVGFYRKLNYLTVGEEFEEVGIPHYQMEKSL